MNNSLILIFQRGNQLESQEQNQLVNRKLPLVEEHYLLLRIKYLSKVLYYR